MKHVLFIVFLSLFITTGCDKLSSMISTNPDSYVEEGIRFMNSGQYVEAGIRFKTALKKNPNHFKANYAFGGLYKRTEHFKEAIVYLTKAMEIEPKNEAVAVDLAYVFIQEKQFEVAIKILEPLSVNPTNPEIYYYLGEAYHQKKEYEEAYKWLTKASKIIPLSNSKLLSNTYGLIGDSLIALNRLTDAEKVLTDAAKLTKNPFVMAKLGATLFGIGNHFHVEMLKARNEIEAINTEIKEARGKAKKKLKKSKEQALIDLQKKLEFNETQRNSVISKAKMYLKEALNSTVASKDMQAATKREVLYHLGMAHLIMAEYVDAKEVLTKFLQNNPGGQESVDVRNKIGQLDELIQRAEQKKLDEENKGKGE
jgi:tetratricopeptide (TPR) repeat protein